ncbi:MAG TPA: lysylphosphatidylglycerol synthase transmembrane domain-containing protein [Pyrinomonadaceae bacterium]
MNSEIKVQIPKQQSSKINPKNIKRLKVLGILFTLLGIGLFVYFIRSVGIEEILIGIGRIGFGGFAVVILLYFARILIRSLAWKLSVYEPYKLDLRDTIPAVIIGEAMSSMIPLGILISGTSKAVAVRNRVPLVVGFSSIATENLFYSLGTSLFLILGAFGFLRAFELAEGWVITIDALIAVIIFLLFLGILMVVRQWHFASAICEWLYDKNIGRNILEDGRLHVRLFENFIYGFYRRYPKRFLPIFLLQIVFHLLGVLEAWFILSKISDLVPSVFTAFLLESVSRLITVVFKLVPFVIGVDEAGAQFITETLAVGAGVGVTLAIIRKGRILFWTAMGLIFIVQRGLSFKEISETAEEARSES